MLDPQRGHELREVRLESPQPHPRARRTRAPQRLRPHHRDLRQTAGRDGAVTAGRDGVRITGPVPAAQRRGLAPK